MTTTQYKSPHKPKIEYTEQGIRIDPNAASTFREDAILKCCANINQRDIVMTLVQSCLDKNVPVTEENLINLFNTLLVDYLSGSAVMAIDAHPEEFKQVTQYSQGNILRKVYNKSAVVLNTVKCNNDCANCKHEITQLYNCANPLCDMKGQCTHQNGDGTLSYYCPKCEMTYRWRNDK